MVSEEVREEISDIIEMMEIIGMNLITDTHDLRTMKLNLNTLKENNKKELVKAKRELEIAMQKSARETDFKSMNITNKEGREGWLNEHFEKELNKIDEMEYQSFLEEQLAIIEKQKAVETNKLGYEVMSARLNFELGDMQSNTVTVINENLERKGKEKIEMEVLENDEPTE